MSIRATLAAALLILTLGAPVAAEAAWTGFAVKTANLRGGPGTGYVKLTIVPAGARLTVFGCVGPSSFAANWCRVRFAGINGWIAASLVTGRQFYGPSPHIAGPSPYFWGPAYPGPYWGSPYWYRRPGVTFWFGF